MKKYDIESFLTDLQTFLASKLNAQFSAIDAEKADSITLKQLQSGAIFVQYLGVSWANFDPFMVIGEVSEPVVQSVGPETAISFGVGIDLVLADEGTDPKVVTRLLRYRRAIMDLITANWDNIGKAQLTKISGLSPTPQFTHQNTSFQARGIGVTLSVTLTC